MSMPRTIVGTPRVYIIRKQSQKTPPRRLYYLEFLNPETGIRESRALGPGREYAHYMKRAFELAIQEYFMTGQLHLPEKGKSPTDRGLSFEELWEQFRTYKVTRIRPSSLEAYRLQLNSFLTTMPDISQPENINEKDVDRFIKRRIGSGIRPATVNSNIRSLKVIFKFGVKRGLLRKDPFRDVEKLKAKPKEKRIITLDEEEKLVQAAENRPCTSLLEKLKMSATIRLAVGAGLRRNEIINLRWEDIDLKTGKIMIRSHDEFVTKNGRDRVSFLTGDDALHILRRLQLMGLGAENRQPFFRKEPRQLSRNFIRLAQKAGVDCCLHDLRRTFVTRLTEAGENTMLIMKLVGHGSVEVTRDHYLGLGDDALREAVERANKRLKKADGA